MFPSFADTPLADARGYSVSIAGGEDVVAAQRLRHDTLGAEFGQLPTLADGRDRDEFDEFADHLVVRHERSGEIVGTYRMMTPRCAAQAGGRFGDRTFDLSPLRDIAEDLVETGRASVHPAHRNGAVITLIWAGIAHYLRLTGFRWLGGTVWMPLDDGGRTAAGIWTAARDQHLAPAAYRVTPRHPLLVDAGPAPIPPLLQGYLRLGSWIAGEPGIDPHAKVAVFYVLLDVEHMSPRYRRHYFDG